MRHIVVEALRKTFRVAERRSGTWGALLGLFHRRYREVRALDGVSFEVRRGELVGYIGPNGAGKSTTVKVLSGILVPDGGHCEVDGRVPWRDRIAHVARIGVVFGQRTQLWTDLPVVESFELLRDIYRVPQVEYERTRDELVGMLELSPLLDTPVRQLSLGQRMRCDLVAALLHRPSILFLDEPTIGLDALAKLAVRDFVKRLNREQGVTVILTTHDMDDIEELARRILVIGNGHILSDGTLDDLRRLVRGTRRLILDIAGRSPPLSLDRVRLVSQEGHRLVFEFDPTEIPTAALIARVTQQYEVRDLFVENPPIEHIIAQLYRHMDDRGAGAVAEGAAS
jgi:ABC-2 type transport system ATP-binding protein